MKIKLKITKEFDVKFLQVRAGVRYWEDADINGETAEEDGSNTPCKNGDNWQPKIDVETGRIINWEQGKTASVHYKVCDDGDYTLIDSKGQVIAKKEGYVISALAPRENGYGDYIMMDINEDGIIEDWDETMLVEDFSDNDD